MLLTCVPKFIRKTKFKQLIDKGNKKIDQLLDIRSLIETTRAIRVLKRLFLNRHQRVMSRLTPLNYIGLETSSDNDKALTDSDQHRSTIQKLDGYKISDKVDRKLMSLI